MKKIYSRVEPDRLLHFIQTPADFGIREELISQGEILQLSCQAVPGNTKFRPHRHIPKKVEIKEITAQESWVIISGRVRVTFYDLDDVILEKIDLEAGDVSVTLAGGHGYEILEDSKILEFKTGPYLGQAQDKVFIAG